MRVLSLINSGADVDYVNEVCHSLPTAIQYLYSHTSTGLMSCVVGTSLKCTGSPDYLLTYNIVCNATHISFRRQ